MGDKNELSAKTLGQIALMQSVVSLLPDQMSMLEFSCRGLNDICGIDAVEFSFYGEPTAEPPIVKSMGGSPRVFPVYRNRHHYAHFRIHPGDQAAFDPYVPYIENFCHMLGVLFEERHQRDVNRDLMAHLEQRVAERTAALEKEIEERRRAEAAVRREKERLAVTLRAIGDGVIATDTRGRVVMMNRMAETLTGWKSEHAQGHPVEEVVHTIDEHSPEDRPLLPAKVLSEGKTIDFTDHVLLRAADGTRRLIDPCAAPITDGSGTVTGAVLVIRDVTEQQKMADTLQRTCRLESLGALAGGIAHDFNNLLGGIYGHIDLAAYETADGTVTRHLEKAMGTIDRARGLTHQLLTFAKGGSPVKRLEPLFPFVQEMVQFALSGSHISSSFTIAKDLWRCEIDKNQIGQAVDNIIINALQAMPDGGTLEIRAENITIGEEGHVQLPAGPYVRIAIQDHGVGIPRDTIQRIFDPFFTTRATGHGLGLSTSYSIVSKHGGCIDVESQPGRGSTFFIYLPACLKAPGEGGQEGFSNEKLPDTILVMDDHEVVRDTLCSMALSLGYRAIQTRNGNEAIAVVKQERAAGRDIAAMVFDLTVPGGMGGKEAVVEVRKIAPKTPVFVASGYADDPVMAHPGDFGFTASLRKPFRRSEFARMLESHLGSGPGDAE